jgi:hypothetical protein
LIETTATGPEDDGFDWDGRIFAAAGGFFAGFWVTFGAEIRAACFSAGATVFAGTGVLIFSAAIAGDEARTNPAIRDGMIRYTALLILPPL